MNNNKDKAYGNENFTIKNGKAYTEDNVLVYNIFVFKISSKVKCEQITEYFEKYDASASIQFMMKKDRRKKIWTPTVAYVNFKNASSAAKALTKGNKLHASKLYFRIKACDSWNQPTSIRELENSVIKTSIYQSNREVLPSINLLNDDCLLNILNKLCLKDQLNFASVSKRFHNIFDMLCKTVYKVICINMFNNLTLMEIREFILISGYCVETLVVKSGAIYKNFQRIIVFLMKYCHNLTTLNISGYNLKSGLIRKMFRKAINIRVLILENCFLSDCSMKAFSRLRKLEVLNLNGNSGLIGTHLPKFLKLKHLSINSCLNIQPTYFIEMCLASPQLVMLDIQRCERLNHTALNEMVSNCKQIETLKVTTALAFECVAKLDKLKNLEVIQHNTPITTKLFSELAQHKSEHLESLQICAKNWMTAERASLICELKNLKLLVCRENDLLTDSVLTAFAKLKQLNEINLSKCSSITNEGLLKLVSSCEKLNLVNIQYCAQINCDFVLSAIDLLKKQQERTKLCHFIVGNTGIKEFIKNVSKYVENKALIKLTFSSESFKDNNLEHYINEDDSEYSEHSDFLNDSFEDLMDDYFEDNDYDPDFLLHDEYDDLFFF